jgi:hypothetical protein
MEVLPAILKVPLYAIAGFVGAYVSFFVCRWWPTTYVDKQGIPKKEIRKIDFKIALGASVVAAGLGLMEVLLVD